jgi:hypothetical protein
LHDPEPLDPEVVDPLLPPLDPAPSVEALASSPAKMFAPLVAVPDPQARRAIAAADPTLIPMRIAIPPVSRYI